MGHEVGHQQHHDLLENEGIVMGVALSGEEGTAYRNYEMRQCRQWMRESAISN